MELGLDLRSFLAHSHRCRVPSSTHGSSELGRSACDWQIVGVIGVIFIVRIRRRCRVVVPQTVPFGFGFSQYLHSIILLGHFPFAGHSEARPDRLYAQFFWILVLYMQGVPMLVESQVPENRGVSFLRFSSSEV